MYFQTKKLLSKTISNYYQQIITSYYSPSNALLIMSANYTAKLSNLSIIPSKSWKVKRISKIKKAIRIPANMVQYKRT